MSSILDYQHHTSKDSKAAEKHSSSEVWQTQRAQYFHLLDDGRVQCDLCPRFCKLKEGQQGLCFVRENQGNKILLTSYGRSSGFCIDPVEKKPLNHFFPGTPVLSFGTAGCNLACKFCQNWDISKSRQMDTLGSEASPRVLAEAAALSGSRSIAFTYNDPVIFHEYAIDVAIAAKEKGINSIAVTAGYVCEAPRKEFYAHMDAANIDLKAFTEGFYRNICGGKLSVVLETLLYLRHETNIWFELTTLLIPGENDSPAEIDLMTKWIVENLGRDIPIHFSAFHPDFKMLDRSATPMSTLTESRRIAIDNGMRYVYTGNVNDPSGGSTYCSNCSGLLIERDWYALGQWHLNEDGRCQHCGHQLPGCFDEKPGSWGRKRQAVNLDKLNEKR